MQLVESIRLWELWSSLGWKDVKRRYRLIVLVGVLCTRFRDVTQVVASLTTVLMFITPVFWLPELTMRVRPYFVEYNIFYHLLEILRQPLLGSAAAPRSYLFAAISAGIGWLIASFVFRRYQRLIPLWL